MSTPENWTYLVEKFPPGAATGTATLEAHLHTRGLDYWELASAVPDGQGLLLIFKQPS